MGQRGGLAALPCLGETLELQSKQRTQACFLVLVGLMQAGGDGLAKLGKRGVIAGIQTLGFRKFPQPFDQIEIGRIGRKKQQLNTEAGGGVEDILAALIAGIVQDEGNGPVGELLDSFLEQLDDGVGIDVSCIRYW